MAVRGQKDVDAQPPLVAGVDGCRAGWLVAMAPATSGRVRVQWHLEPDIASVAERTRNCAAVAIDIPIGLLDGAAPGGRPCDVEARRLLPSGWKSSVFAPPCRAVLAAPDYPTALAINRASSSHGIGLSKQAWNIVAKIREVDEFVNRAGPSGWIETLPELAFLHANLGTPLGEKKKTPGGQRARRRLLTQFFGPFKSRPEDLFPRSQVQIDDLWDALICAWVAGRYSRGEARPIAPSTHPTRPDHPIAIWI